MVKEGIPHEARGSSPDCANAPAEALATLDLAVLQIPHAAETRRVGNFEIAEGLLGGITEEPCRSDETGGVKIDGVEVFAGADDQGLGLFVGEIVKLAFASRVASRHESIFPRVSGTCGALVVVAVDHGFVSGSYLFAQPLAEFLVLAKMSASMVIGDY